MSNILSSVTDFLTKDDWKFTVDEQKPIVRLSISGKNGKFRCYGRGDDEDGDFVFYSVYQITVPDEKRQEVAIYLTLANYGLTMGNFEMDLRDGEIRYKTSIRLDGAPFDERIVRHIIYANVSTADKYFPGVMRILYGDIAPQQAVEEVESKDAEEGKSEPSSPGDKA